MLEPYADWVTAVSSLVMAVASAALVAYSYVTIKEGKKNRRKDTIEKMLDNVYSPLYEILRRAQFADNWRKEVRRIDPPREYALEEQEFTEARNIVERYGHYLGHVERMAVTNALEKYEVVEYGRKKYYRFRLVDIDEHWMYVWKTCESLREELERLAKV
jgi:hypothetical protein